MRCRSVAWNVIFPPGRHLLHTKTHSRRSSESVVAWILGIPKRSSFRTSRSSLRGLYCNFYAAAARWKNLKPFASIPLSLSFFRHRLALPRPKFQRAMIYSTNKIYYTRFCIISKGKKGAVILFILPFSWLQLEGCCIMRWKEWMNGSNIAGSVGLTN